jgi:threonylcarbamoyladenosine tRNA methylthiotransferase MtaB
MSTERSDLKPKVGFYTLGCKVNQYDTEALKTVFKQSGYDIVAFEDIADVYVVNTCTVTAMADKKSRQVLRRAKKRNPSAIIVATGCYSQTASDKLAHMPEVDVVAGTIGRARLPELVQTVRDKRCPAIFVSDFHEGLQFEEIGISHIDNRVRATIKIQEGCEQYCSYCRIPYARGPIRSRELEDIVVEVSRLAILGVKEIVLTGIHLGTYGTDFNSPCSLADVLKELHSIGDIQRIRLSSIEPMEVTPELIDIFADYPKLCRHLHMPLQSGDNEILRLMNRDYTVVDYKGVVQQVRDRIPDVGITTDIMVGFPGESDERFYNTLQTVQDIRFSRVHVFKYSKRAGTPAYDFPHQVGAQTKHERSEKLISTGMRLAREFSEHFTGKKLQVLFEEYTEENIATGYSDNYIKVMCETSRDVVGRIVPVEITEVKDDHVFGVV